MLRTIKVEQRENPTIDPIIYKDVLGVEDVFDENGNYCHKLILNCGDSATFTALDWKFSELKFVSLF